MRARNITEEKDLFNLQPGGEIDFTLLTGEEVTAMVLERMDCADAKECELTLIFKDCLRDEFRMNKEWTNEGGYEESELRRKLGGVILGNIPTEIRKMMIPCENGDLLRLPTEKEIFGENEFGEEEPDAHQFELMKERRNRIAFQGKNGEWEWYWLQNKAVASSPYFAYCSADGDAAYNSASTSYGVRPLFKLRIV